MLPGVREALAQRMHDHGIDDALADAIEEWASAGGGPVVGIIGGHAEPRGSAGYRAAAAIGHALARHGLLVVSGGGPGVMEATNLGAFLSTADADALEAAIKELSAAPDFRDHDQYTTVALEVRARFTQPAPEAEPAKEAEPALAPKRRGGGDVPPAAKEEQRTTP